MYVVLGHSFGLDQYNRRVFIIREIAALISFCYCLSFVVLTLAMYFMIYKGFNWI